MLHVLLTDLIHRLNLGLHGLRSRRLFANLLAISLLIWTLETGIIVVSLAAFGLWLPPDAAITTIIILSLATMIPAAPGFVGTYQLSIMTALSVYGADGASALAMSIFLNIFIIVVTTIVGVAAILHKGGLRDALTIKQAL
jgi:uncharacterized membrane protein YbhN (UPF0104 family)